MLGVQPSRSSSWLHALQTPSLSIGARRILAHIRVLVRLPLVLSLETHCSLVSRPVVSLGPTSSIFWCSHERQHEHYRFSLAFVPCQDCSGQARSLILLFQYQSAMHVC